MLIQQSAKGKLHVTACEEAAKGQVNDGLGAHIPDCDTFSTVRKDRWQRRKVTASNGLIKQFFVLRILRLERCCRARFVAKGLSLK